jgi:nucleotide-binding universal stress UspA family protein
MAVMVAVPDSAEGRRALEAGVAESRQLDTDLVIVNLTLHALDMSSIPADLPYTVVERHGKGPAEAVLDALDDHAKIDRLVICVARRTPVGKAMLGSVSQRLLLEAEVPVVAVKLPANGKR